jgi:VIT1/CCC1 family predicted Fe2+/Mn2+ transporter
LVRKKLLQMAEPSARPRLTKSDSLGALGICLLVFLSTFPVAIPFLLIGDAWLALRVSNAVAIAMLFLCGYAFGHYAGLRPWRTGLAMVAIGGVLVAITIALGG